MEIQIGLWGPRLSCREKALNWASIGMKGNSILERQSLDKEAFEFCGQHSERVGPCSEVNGVGAPSGGIERKKVGGLGMEKE